MRRILLAALLFCSASIVSTASAEKALKIGFVDLERALAESEPGEKAQAEYEKEVKSATSKIKAKRDDLDKLKDRFNSQKDSLNDDAYSRKKEELISQQKDFERSYKDSQEALQRRNAQIVGELVKNIRTVVQEIGKAEGYTVILEGSEQTVLFMDKAVDITGLVVDRFNDKY